MERWAPTKASAYRLLDQACMEHAGTNAGAWCALSAATSRMMPMASSLLIDTSDAASHGNTVATGGVRRGRAAMGAKPEDLRDGGRQAKIGRHDLQ